jgi:filamentous hemagglutinin family protein
MQGLSRELLGGTALTRAGLFTAGLSFIVQPAMALPQGGTVAGGSATIVQNSPQQLTVNQQSSTAVIDWHAFSIGQNETTTFNQPNAGSVAVNRVTGVDPSQIEGHLNANGQVILINPNGVLFTKTAQVNVGGLVASTSSITTANAMSGKMVFDQSSSSKTATVVNRGTITAAQGGLVALVAPGVANSGVITANLGKVSLASGDKWTLDLYGDHLVNFAVNDQVKNQVAGPDNTGLGVSHTGTIIASAGTVELTANVAKGIVSNAINMGGVIQATSVSGKGGSIVLSGGQSGVSITGKIDASGTSGGTVTVTGDTVTNQGTIHADGTAGQGGQVTVSANSAYIDTQNAVITANGTAKGGSVSVGSAFSFYGAGHYAATSSQGAGGQVTVTGNSVALIGADIDASGFTQGGTISLGGGPHGSGTVAHAATLYASATTSVKADATNTGNGGTIAVWSDQNTEFAGATEARGGPQGGDGGLIDVSSAGTVTYGGIANASAPLGAPGELLLDPKTIIVDAVSGVFPQFDLVNPNPGGGGAFGSVSVVLSSGNVVVTDPNATLGLGPLAAGASYLFNGMTGQLISVLNGSHIGDHVGSNVTVLTNGSYVVSESTWNGGMGAATWGSGTLGVSGSVSASNSLTGSTIGDQVGLNVTALANGNYVVGSPNWAGNKGAASWGNGTTGLTGVVSAANSLVGSTAGDQVGLNVTVLANGNYVVGSPNWSGNKGAATWGNGASGISGTVTLSNSLLGSLTGDEVGLKVTALTSGDYVVGSPDWNGTRGAATRGSGTAGLDGTITASNSLIGSLIGDEVGLNVTALANGDYVVGSPDWNGDRGAASWGGSAGVTGTVSTSNSLIGSALGDEVGLNVTALANGNYVVGSPDWNGDKGAATWANGGIGLTGTITVSNSLIGSAIGDEVGLAVSALTNGNYVVGSPDWNGDKGAATWANGTVGLTGTIAASNSLVGSTTGDEVGLSVTALANGNYVVGSPDWNGNRGAASWGSGTLGLDGAISASNALVGSNANDQVGLSVTALTDGNYVVGSPHCNGNQGAATWGSGTVGIAGTITASNSLVGSQSGDEVGLSVSALGGGAYVVSSPDWNGLLGAATFGAAGAALTGTIGVQNSIEGTVAQTLGVLGISKLLGGTAGFLVSFATAGSGEVVEGLQSPNALTYGQNPSGTVTITPTFLTNTLDTGTSVTLQANDDIIVDSPIVTIAPLGTGGNLTLDAGRSLIFNAGIATDNGNLTLVANDTAADGVVDADRDPGNASITMNSGANFVAGSGTVSIDLKTGAGITNAASGGIVLNGIQASAINVVDENTGTLTLNGQLSASASGNAIVLSTGVIDNNYGASALSTGAGRYILYSTSPLTDTLNGLVGYSKEYGITYGSLPPVSVSAGGDWSFYGIVPTLTVDVNSASRTYGAANPAFGYTVSGYIDGDTASTALSGSATYSTSATTASNVGTYAVGLSGGLSSPLGYNIVTVGGNLTVTPASLTISPENATKLYGAVDPVFAATYGGLVNGDSSGVVTGLTLASTGTASSNVGSYNITGSGAVASNYTISYAVGTLAVTPASLTISADNASRLYGSVNPSFSASYTGLVNGDSSAVVSGLSLSTSATTLSNVGTYTIGGTGASASNYTISYVGGVLSVTPASLTITADNATKLYGAANPALSAAYQGLLNGDASTVVSGLSLATTATSASNVGTYSISASGGSAQNYNITYGASGTLSVTPAALTITANNAAKIYGDANPTLSGSFTGLVNGDTSAAVTGISYSTAATVSSNIGAYGIQASGGLDANYNITYASGTLTIGKAQLTITADNATKLYGAVDPAFDATYTGLKNGDSSSAVTGLTLSSTGTSSSNVGTYAISGSGAMAQNYNISYVNGQLSVTPASLTIMSNNASRLYGAANPALGATYSGLVNGDSSSVVSGLSLSTSATTASNVGSYAITGMGATASNYAITYDNGVLSVTPAPLTVTANNATRLYGSANPAFSASYSGFVNGDTTAAVSGVNLSTSATSASNVGSYNIAASGGTAQNYAITYGPNGTLAVTPASLTIMANDAAKVYGSANPALSGSFTGLVNGDTSAAVTGVSYTTAATSSSGIGTYAIQAGGGFDANYNITYAAGNLTIGKALLTITPDNETKLYGAADPALGATYSGLVNGDNSGVVTGLMLSTAATSASNVGNYAISATAAAASNYAITYGPNGTLAVTPASLTIQANNASRLYGSANPAFSATYTGLVNGDSSGVVTGLSLASAATSASNVGTYAIQGTNGMASNYNITYAAGMLSVTPASLTITADNATRLYGAANPAFAASYNGFVNGDGTAAISGLSLTSSATSTSNVGGYGIVAAGGTAQNYTISYGSAGTLMVTPAPLTITANNVSRTYGQGNNLSASYQGLVAGDTSGVVSGLTLSTSATSASNVGTYAVQAAGGTAQNYNVSYGANGTLTVDPASLTINVSNLSKVYGAANPTLAASYAGLVNGDSTAVVSGLSLSTGATSASHVGTYAIDGSGATAQNYAVTYNQGVMSITPAPLYATSTDGTRLYGGANPSFSATYSGFVNGDTTASLGQTSFATAGATANVGTYQVVPVSSDADYRIVYTGGTLTVTPAPLTVTPNNSARVVDTANPDFTATFQGLVNGDPSSVVTGLSITTTAGMTSPVGLYQIVASGGSAGNYTLSYGPPAMLEVTVPGANPPAGPGSAPTSTPTPVSTPAMPGDTASLADPATPGDGSPTATLATDTTLSVATPSANLSKIVSQAPNPIMLQMAGNLAAAASYPYFAGVLGQQQTQTVCLKVGLTTEVSADTNESESTCAAPLSIAGF